MESKSENTPLLTSYKMGRFNLTHRVVLPPLTRNRSYNNMPQPHATEYYAQRSTAGGFLISEATSAFDISLRCPNMPGIWREDQVEAWKPIVKAVHAKGGIIFCQIWHPGRISNYTLKHEEIDGKVVVGSTELKSFDVQGREVHCFDVEAREVHKNATQLGNFSSRSFTTMDRSFFTIEDRPFTTMYRSFTIEDKPFTTMDRSFTTMDKSFTTEDKSFTTMDRSFTTEDRPFTFTTMDRSFTTEDKPFTTMDRSFTTEDRPFTTMDRSFTTEDRPFTTMDRSFITEERPFTTTDKPFTTMDRSFTTEDEDRPFTTMDRPFITADRPFTTMDRSFTTMDRSFTTKNKPFTTMDRSFTTMNMSFTTENRPFTTMDRSFITEDRPFTTMDRSFIIEDGSFTTVDKVSKDHAQKGSTPSELTFEEIFCIINHFRVAARNAIDAGFDGIEIHCSNGYLIDQFLNDHFNVRIDHYDGSLEKRCGLALQVVEAVVEEIGADKVGVKLSPFDDFNGHGDLSPQVIGTYIANKLNELGVLYLHVTEPRMIPVGDTYKTPFGLLPIRKAFKGTLIASGGYDKSDGDKAIAENYADLVSFGRLFLANPDLPKRFELNAPLNKHERKTFYTQDPVVGYTDYPPFQTAC